MTERSTGPRVVDHATLDTCVGILVGAFYDDTLWSWAFPDGDRRRAQHEAFWRVFVRGASRYPFTWLTADDTATAVWIPPDGTELGDEQEQELVALLDGELRSEAERVRLALDLLEEAHPRYEPHYYLSLLGTDPAHRGRGHGLALLAENLAHVDDEGMPAYLEASNPVNVPLYERYGFREWTRFQVPDGGPEIVTMWRASSGRRQQPG